MGEVIYKDSKSAICRRWNWREADRTKLTGSTKNAIFFVEGVAPTTEAEVLVALEELKSLLLRFECGEVTLQKVISIGQSENVVLCNP